MGVLSELQPADVFRYFEEICSVPHGSGNTGRISGYCTDFARGHGLEHIQDSAGNVIIFKNGSPGYENSDPVIIQGHLDMVCEKTADCGIDFEKDGLSLRAEDGTVFAEGTTLGGDDGIAVAYALALLASDSIAHPPLEVVLTVDEEIGMLGAAALDFSPLRSRIMMNIDSENEGCLLVSCAGGAGADCVIPVAREVRRGVKAELKISGLLGGHSGTEINKGRASSNRLMGRVLNELGKTVSFSLISVNGGSKDNAIPRETTAGILIDAGQEDVLNGLAGRFQEIFSREYCVTDPDITLSAAVGREAEEAVMNADSQKRVICALLNMPSGVQRMSADIEGLVQTSLNMGILKTGENEVFMGFSVRSSLSSEKEELLSRLESLTELLGGSMSVAGSYPAWEYCQKSRLRPVMEETYERMYGKKPAVQAIHAGLECGLFAGAIPGLDCVSFGPDIEDIHTVNERMSAASVERTWRYLIEVLKELK